jgi:hypothetical protein
LTPQPVEIVSDGLQSVFESVIEPRIHSPLNDLPSRGFELIDFAEQIIPGGFMPWQKWLAEHSLKIKSDGRYQHPITVASCARQNGKSTYMIARIMMGLFNWDESLQVSTAHRLVTSLEQFRSIVQIIEENADLANQVKRIRWQHGAEEIQTIKGNRFIIKAGGSAARGLSKPETIHMDEIRELHDMETFAAMRYTLMAAKNPQVNCFSTAGDSHSIVLNQLRERGLAAASGASDDVGYFEWSAPTDEITIENAAFANPGLNITIHPDNIRAVFNDPPDVVMTEVLNRWVQTISAVIGSKEWQACGDESIDLDEDKLTWMAIDISPDRRNAALVAAQKLGDESFIVKLLHTWENTIQLDDRAVANDAASYCRKYPIEYLLYSRRTTGAIAARLLPAGIPIHDMDSSYPQACDELLGAINSGRLKHRNQAALTEQMLSAVQLRRGDGGWVIGRRASQSSVAAAVAAALCTHFATRPETEIDILVG